MHLLLYFLNSVLFFLLLKTTVKFLLKVNQAKMNNLIKLFSHVFLSNILFLSGKLFYWQRRQLHLLKLKVNCKNTIHLEFLLLRSKENVEFFFY